MKFKCIDVDEVKVHARSGAHVGECLKECVLLAFTEWRDVILIHNDKEYIINPNGILDSLYKE